MARLARQMGAAYTCHPHTSEVRAETTLSTATSEPFFQTQMTSTCCSPAAVADGSVPHASCISIDHFAGAGSGSRDLAQQQGRTGLSSRRACCADGLWQHSTCPQNHSKPLGGIGGSGRCRCKLDIWLPGSEVISRVMS